MDTGSVLRPPRLVVLLVGASIAVARGDAALPGGATASSCRAAPDHGELAGLVVTGQPTRAPTHGGTHLIGKASYTLRNTTAAPVSLHTGELRVCSEPETVALPVVALWLSGEAPGPPRRFAPAAELVIPAGATLRLDVEARVGPASFRYHQRYWHVLRFDVGTASLHARASDLWFRYPHRH